MLNEEGDIGRGNYTYQLQSLNLSKTFLSLWGFLQHFSRHFSKQLLRWKFYNGCSSLFCEMTVPSRIGDPFTLSISMTLQTITTTSILHLSELPFGPVFSLILRVRNFGQNICQLGKVSFSRWTYFFQIFSSSSYRMQ